ncbi:MAG: hypothetical protein IT233_02580 [Bacteroidia bacterium]|nr:hypothetical protein [Bacteroidia bacterium]
MNTSLRLFLLRVFLTPIVAAFGFLILTSFQKDEQSIEIPADLDKETVVFSKSIIIKAWVANAGGYFGQKGEVEKTERKLVDKEFNECKKAFEKYPFKCVFVDANCIATTFSDTGWAMNCKDIDFPKDAKYEFILPEDKSDILQNYNLQIREISSGKTFKIIKVSHGMDFTDRSANKVIRAIKEKYSK